MITISSVLRLHPTGGCKWLFNVFGHLVMDVDVDLNPISQSMMPSPSRRTSCTQSAKCTSRSSWTSMDGLKSEAHGAGCHVPKPTCYRVEDEEEGKDYWCYKGIFQIIVSSKRGICFVTLPSIRIIPFNPMWYSSIIQIVKWWTLLCFYMLV